MIHILIIDDEDPIRNLLARMVELEGYQASKAADCRSALKMLNTQRFEVVLCDVFLPDGNGVNFIFDIHRIQPDAAVILLTAHGNIPDGVQAIKNGAFDYITKGDDNRKIIPTISRAIEESEKKRGRMTLLKHILFSLSSVSQSVCNKQSVWLKSSQDRYPDFTDRRDWNRQGSVCPCHSYSQRPITVSYRGN